MRTELENAQQDQILIALEREEVEPGRDLGYVVGLGPELVLLQRVSDGMRPNGFSVLRIGDISDLEAPHEHAAFVESALRLRGESGIAAPAIELSDFSSAARTAGRLFEVVTFHCEVEDPDGCRIGSVQAVTPHAIELVEIDPDADWEDEVSEVEVGALTRIDFGGDYEEALVLVGGRCPERG